MVRECVGTGKDKHCHWDSRYDYEIEEYVNNRVVATNGVYPSVPNWPTYVLSEATGPRGIGKEREGWAVEIYSLHFASKENYDDSYEWNGTQAEWSNYSPHQTVFITTCVNHVYKIRPLEVE